MMTDEDRTFLEAVFAVARQALESRQPLEELASGELLLCAAETLRLIATRCPPDTAPAVLAEFRGFPEVAAVGPGKGQTPGERILRLLTFSFQLFWRIRQALATGVVPTEL